jgi:hypothetical protein
LSQFGTLRKLFPNWDTGRIVGIGFVEFPNVLFVNSDDHDLAACFITGLVLDIKKL